jgi:predicted Fe-Mo cluster-binding NifX family protein
MTIQTAAAEPGSEGEGVMSRIGISVTRDGEGMHAVMDSRFGRAEAFLVVERESGEVVETIGNASVGSSHGAGIAAANTMKSIGVDAVISGRFGPKAFDALRALGIETWVAPSGITAGEAFRMLDDAGLERMQS